jgi:hypothetical protein
MWLAHIENASMGVVSELRVVVTAIDGDDNLVPDAVRKATGELDISGAMEKNHLGRAGRWHQRHDELQSNRGSAIGTWSQKSQNVSI